MKVVIGGGWRGLAFVLISTSCSCVEPFTGLLEYPALLVGPDTIDFGLVAVGESKNETITLENPGPGGIEVLGVRVEGTTPGFTARNLTVPVELLLGDTIDVTAGFEPLMSTDGQREATLILETNQGPHAIRLLGRAVQPALRVTPNPMDFGIVEAGQTKSLVALIENVSDTSLNLETNHIAGLPAFEDLRAEGEFRIETSVASDNSFPAGRSMLGPGESLEVPIHYTPKVDGYGGLDTASWRLWGCQESDSCQSVVELLGESPPADFECQPSAVDFGLVRPLERAEQTVVCTNTGDRPLQFAGRDITSEVDGAPFEVFGPGPQGVPPGGSIEIQVAFAPRAEHRPPLEFRGRLRVLTHNPVTQRDVAQYVDLFGTVFGPHIVVEPNPIEFGPVIMRTVQMRDFVVRNIGNERLDVTDMLDDVAQTGVFRVADRQPFSLEPGQQRRFVLELTTEVASFYESALRFNSNDPIEPQLDVPITAHVYDPSACQPEVTPEYVDFGLVNLGGEPRVLVTLTNNGLGDCFFDPPVVSGPEAQEFDVRTGNWIPALAAGEMRLITVFFRPTSLGVKNAQIDLNYQIANITVRLQGTVVDSGASLECSPPQTVLAGNVVQLWVRDVSVMDYRWSIVDAPPGGIGTPDQWNPDPPNRTEVEFLPYIVGTYTLRVTATDALGNATSCDTTVTAEGHGLRAQLTWDGAGDIDLHLLRATGQPWHSDDDCSYSNRSPNWDAAFSRREGPNPSLDFDNRREDGPENTRIDDPVIGTRYIVGVHHYSGGIGRRARIQIFCGSGTTAQLDVQSRPLQGTATGRCSNNDFWKVAAVSFTGNGNCNILRLDQYITAASACLAP